MVIGRAAVALSLVLGLAPVATAQTIDPIAQARALEKAGDRPGAIAALRTRIAAAPNDDDARFLLGLYVSFAGQYDEARITLEGVVARRPEDIDAIAALMNVEWWSGRLESSKALAERGLAIKTEGRFVTGRQRAIDAIAAKRPVTVFVRNTRDWFSDDRPSWTESAVSLKAFSRKGTFTVEASRARRFGLSDEQFQAELYPRFRPGTYAYVGIAASSDRILYPKSRIGAELFQLIGAGIEVSAGFRRFNFSTPATQYTGAVTKYAGNWLVTGRVSRIPNRNGESSSSFHGLLRRYVGTDGLSYVGLRYNHGLAREEIVSVNDFEVLSSNTVSAEADLALGSRWRVAAQAGTSRQERVAGVSFRQNTVSATLGFRF